MGGTRLQVLACDGGDTMLTVWHQVEDGDTPVVAMHHVDGFGAVTWTVWRTEDLVHLPESLHLSGLRHAGPLLSLAERRGIETWPADTPAPPDRAVLLVAGDLPVALVLPSSNPAGDGVFEVHRDLPPDEYDDPAPDIPMDGAADDEVAAADDDGLTAADGDDGDDGDDGEDASPGTPGTVTWHDADKGYGFTEPADSPDEWWDVGPAEPDGPARGGGEGPLDATRMNPAVE